MSDSIRRELRLLKGYALVVTVLLGTLSIAAFRQSAQKTRFTEIDVERINIVEPDGALRMVISNRPRSIGPIYKGKPFGYPGGRGPGSSSSMTRAPRTAGSPSPAGSGTTGPTPHRWECRSTSSTRTRP